MLSIGPIQLDVPMMQAALAGYSDAPMRLLSRAYGCPFALNEVVLDRLVHQGGKRMRRMLAIPDRDRPVGGQIMGATPEEFAAAANRLVAMGYDLVDLNFGCPVRKVLGKARGGFLLSTPDRACEILRAVTDAVGSRVPVTVKMRRGLDDSAESERAFFTILDAAYELGAVAVTVHGRSVVQRYVGPSDWGFLARVKKHVGTATLLGSGDLFSAADAVRMLDETGVDGVSLARGAIGNPFIFGEIRELLAGRPLPPPPTIAAQRAAIEQHFALMVDHYGEPLARRFIKKFAVRYSDLHPCTREVMLDFVHMQQPADWQAVLDKWYHPARTYPRVVRKPRPESLVAAGATLEGRCEATAEPPEAEKDPSEVENDPREAENAPPPEGN